MIDLKAFVDELNFIIDIKNPNNQINFFEYICDGFFEHISWNGTVIVTFSGSEEKTREEIYELVVKALDDITDRAISCSQALYIPPNKNNWIDLGETDLDKPGEFDNRRFL